MNKQRFNLDTGVLFFDTKNCIIGRGVIVQVEIQKDDSYMKFFIYTIEHDKFSVNYNSQYDDSQLTVVEEDYIWDNVHEMMFSFMNVLDYFKNLGGNKVIQLGEKTMKEYFRSREENVV